MAADIHALYSLLEEAQTQKDALLYSRPARTAPEQFHRYLDHLTTHGTELSEPCQLVDQCIRDAEPAVQELVRSLAEEEQQRWSRARQILRQRAERPLSPDPPPPPPPPAPPPTARSADSRARPPALATERRAQQRAVRYRRLQQRAVRPAVSHTTAARRPDPVPPPVPPPPPLPPAVVAAVPLSRPRPLAESVRRALPHSHAVPAESLPPQRLQQQQRRTPLAYQQFDRVLARRDATGASVPGPVTKPRRGVVRPGGGYSESGRREPAPAAVRSDTPRQLHDGLDVSSGASSPEPGHPRPELASHRGRGLRPETVRSASGSRGGAAIEAPSESRVGAASEAPSDNRVGAASEAPSARLREEVHRAPGEHTLVADGVRLKHASVAAVQANGGVGEDIQNLHEPVAAGPGQPDTDNVPTPGHAVATGGEADDATPIGAAAPGSATPLGEPGADPGGVSAASQPAADAATVDAAAADAATVGAAAADAAAADAPTFDADAATGRTKPDRGVKATKAPAPHRKPVLQERTHQARVFGAGAATTRRTLSTVRDVRFTPSVGVTRARTPHTAGAPHATRRAPSAGPTERPASTRPPSRSTGQTVQWRSSGVAVSRPRAGPAAGGCGDVRSDVRWVPMDSGVFSTQTGHTSRQLTSSLRLNTFKLIQEVVTASMAREEVSVAARSTPGSDSTTVSDSELVRATPRSPSAVAADALAYAVRSAVHSRQMAAVSFGSSPPGGSSAAPPVSVSAASHMAAGAAAQAVVLAAAAAADGGGGEEVEGGSAAVPAQRVDPLGGSGTSEDTDDQVSDVPLDEDQSQPKLGRAAGTQHGIQHRSDVQASAPSVAPAAPSVALAAPSVAPAAPPVAPAQPCSAPAPAPRLFPPARKNITTGPPPGTRSPAGAGNQHTGGTVRGGVSVADAHIATAHAEGIAGEGGALGGFDTEAARRAVIVVDGSVGPGSTGSPVDGAASPAVHQTTGAFPLASQLDGALAASQDGEAPPVVSQSAVSRPLPAAHTRATPDPIASNNASVAVPARPGSEQTRTPAAARVGAEPTRGWVAEADAGTMHGWGAVKRIRAAPAGKVQRAVSPSLRDAERRGASQAALEDGGTQTAVCSGGTQKAVCSGGTQTAVCSGGMQTAVCSGGTQTSPRSLLTAASETPQQQLMHADAASVETAANYEAQTESTSPASSEVSSKLSFAPTPPRGAIAVRSGVTLQLEDDSPARSGSSGLKSAESQEWSEGELRVPWRRWLDRESAATGAFAEPPAFTAVGFADPLTLPAWTQRPVPLQTGPDPDTSLSEGELAVFASSLPRLPSGTSQHYYSSTSHPSGPARPQSRAARRSQGQLSSDGDRSAMEGTSAGEISSTRSPTGSGRTGAQLSAVRSLTRLRSDLSQVVASGAAARSRDVTRVVSSPRLPSELALSAGERGARSSAAGRDAGSSVGGRNVGSSAGERDAGSSAGERSAQGQRRSEGERGLSAGGARPPCLEYGRSGRHGGAPESHLSSGCVSSAAVGGAAHIRGVHVGVSAETAVSRLSSLPEDPSVEHVPDPSAVHVPAPSVTHVPDELSDGEVASSEDTGITAGAVIVRHVKIREVRGRGWGGGEGQFPRSTPTAPVTGRDGARSDELGVLAESV